MVAVDPWTQSWWDTLPSAYRMADKAITYPTPMPMRQFMDGAGNIAGYLRRMSDAGWDGGFTDPATVSDDAVFWLAQMLGVSWEQRQGRTAAEMRQYLVDITENGRPADGTRGAIADVVRTMLTGSRMVSVVPSKTAAHTIVMLVREEEVPGGVLQNLVDAVRKANVVPAGHDVIAVNAQPTWDEFEAAAPDDWNSFDAATPTWAQADSIGVNLT